MKYDDNILASLQSIHQDRIYLKKNLLLAYIYHHYNEYNKISLELQRVITEIDGNPASGGFIEKIREVLRVKNEQTDQQNLFPQHLFYPG